MSPNPDYILVKNGIASLLLIDRSALAPLPAAQSPTVEAVVKAAMDWEKTRASGEARTHQANLAVLLKAVRDHAATLVPPDPKREAVERAIKILHAVSFGETSQVVAASKLQEASDAAAALEAAFREGGKS